MGLGGTGHCVFHKSPSDSHIGDIREILPGRMGACRLQARCWYLPPLVVAKTPRCYYSAGGGICVWVCCFQTPILKSKHRVGAQIVVLL